MDFVTNLPLADKWLDTVTTIEDRVTKQKNSVAFRETDSAEEVATAFFHNVFWLHSLPDDLVSVRDPKFTSMFWIQLTDLRGTQLKCQPAIIRQLMGPQKSWTVSSVTTSAISVLDIKEIGMGSRRVRI